jgi:hypothetical protein
MFLGPFLVIVQYQKHNEDMWVNFLYLKNLIFQNNPTLDEIGGIWKDGIYQNLSKLVPTWKTIGIFNKIKKYLKNVVVIRFFPYFNQPGTCTIKCFTAVIYGFS